MIILQPTSIFQTSWSKSLGIQRGELFLSKQCLDRFQLCFYHRTNNGKCCRNRKKNSSHNILYAIKICSFKRLPSLQKVSNNFQILTIIHNISLSRLTLDFIRLNCLHIYCCGKSLFNNKMTILFLLFVFIFPSDLWS